MRPKPEVGKPSTLGFQGQGTVQFPSRPPLAGPSHGTPPAPEFGITAAANRKLDSCCAPEVAAKVRDVVRRKQGSLGAI